MSELTTCNYCNLKNIKREAKAVGKKVTILDDAEWGLCGRNIYVHPPEINIRLMKGGEDGPRSKYRIAWMKEISKICCC